MVLGVCRRVLDNEHDAEDAFQAAFLVLARQAHTIHKMESVGSWLYGVAYRISLRARSDAARRRTLEEQARTMSEQDPFLEAAWRELRPVLDEEVGRLPPKYRAPIVLCYLEGKTNTEAARELGWTKGTVSGRLARARELLRSRLARRGVALTPALLLLLLSHKELTITVSTMLAVAAVSAAHLSKTGVAVATGVVSARAWEWASLALKTEPVWHLSVMTKAGIAAATLLVGVLLSLQLAAGWTGTGGGGCHGSSSLPKPCQTPDRESMQGTWLLATSERGGRRDPPEALQGVQVQIEQDEITFLASDRRETWRFGVDARVEYRWIDLAQGSVLRQGIYKLQDETLILCLALPGDKRPTDFKSGPGTRHTLSTYRREAGTACANGTTPP